MNAKRVKKLRKQAGWKPTKGELTEEQQKSKSSYKKLKRANRTRGNPQQKKKVENTPPSPELLAERAARKAARQLKRANMPVTELMIEGQKRKLIHDQTLKALELAEATVRAQIEQEREEADSVKLMNKQQRRAEVAALMKARQDANKAARKQKEANNG